MATIIVNRLGIPGASTMPLVVSILCHFVLTFTCLICFAGLLYIFTRSVNFSWPAGILFIVLVSSLGYVRLSAAPCSTFTRVRNAFASSAKRGDQGS